MKTMIVTGAGGFLGSEVVSYIASLNKFDITLVVSGKKKHSFPDNVSVCVADLLADGGRFLEQIKPDIFVHLAWGKQDGMARNADDNIKWLEASFRLLREFVDNGGKRFIFAGTSSEYENCIGLCQENAEYVQMTLYGETKKAFTNVASNYCKRVGVEFVDVRLFTVYGENDQHEFGAIPMCTRTLLHNETFICTAPNSIRDYVYVKDVAKAMDKIISSNYSGIVNVSSGQPKSMREVFGFVAKELGKEDLLRFENEDKCDLILVGDNSVLMNEIGFNGFTKFEDGLRKTINWWKSNSKKTSF